MSRDEIIEALATYYHISPNSPSFLMGSTVLGSDGEYRWLTLNNVVEALEDLCEEDDDWDD